MSFTAIQGIAELDAGGYVSGGQDVVATQDDVATSSDGLSDSLFDVNPAGIAAAGALAGIGTAAQRVLDDTQELRESLGRTAVDMDLTRDETEALARSLSDATFPLEDATATMDALARQGVETEDEMRRLAQASDLLADATGTSAESVANNLAPAVRGLDGDLDAIEENADAFTGVVRNTTLEMDDLAMTMERSSDELQDMGASSDEAAALIAAYGEETGKSGRQLRRDFSSELRDAEGDMDAFMQSTGLSEDQVRQLRDEMGEGSDMTREYADAANESLTTMDELRAGFDDARLALGGYLEPVAAGAPALQALGGAGLFMSTVNTGAVIPSIIGVTTALTPLLPILLPLAAAIGGFAVAWNKGWIDPVETATWAAERIGGAIEWLIGKFMDFYPPIVLARELWESNFLGIQDTTESVFNAIGGFIDWLIEKINSIPGVSIGEDGDVDVDDVDDDAETGQTAGAEMADGAADAFEEDATAHAAEREVSGVDDDAADDAEDRDDGFDRPAAAMAAADEEQTEKLIDQFVMLRNDVQSNTDAIKQLFEVTWEMALDIDDRDFERFVEDIAETTIREELR